ncbi:condensation domain-containing protein [Pyxidicoccus sp. 3LG]
MRPIAELLRLLEERDIRLAVDAGSLRLDAPKGSLTPELRAELSQRKPELLSFLGQARTAGRTAAHTEPIPPVSRAEPLPLSFAQQRLWLIERMGFGGNAYNTPANMRLHGPLDALVLRACLQELIHRHEALRTRFQETEGSPAQQVLPPPAYALPEVDLSHLPPPERERELARLTIEENTRPFDLSRGLLLRSRLFRMDETDHVLVSTFHHIASDGWSLDVYLKELVALYPALAARRPSPLPPLPIQYADFAVWQRRWLQGERLDSQLAYWRKALSELEPLALFTDSPRPSVRKHAPGAGQRILLSRARITELEKLGRTQGATLFMTLLAAFQTLLYRYTGQERITVGSPIANRNRSELEGLIGFFVNSLVLCGDFRGDPPFVELLRRIREMALGAYAHPDLPFEKLVESLQPERDPSQNPLFQVIFSFQQRKGMGAAIEAGGMTFLPLHFEENAARFDLELHVWEDPEGFQCQFIYDTGLFRADTITRMLGHYQTLLDGIVAQPDRRLSALPLLTAAEQRQLEAWSMARA